MILAHVQFVHVNTTDSLVEYSVRSDNLSPSSGWVALGVVVIDKILQKYVFFASERWQRENGMPPEVFGMSDEIKEYIRAKKIYSSVAWSIQIHTITDTLIRHNFYPAGSWGRGKILHLIQKDNFLWQDQISE
jgi:hypothetical protein